MACLQELPQALLVKCEAGGDFVMPTAVEYDAVVTVASLAISAPSSTSLVSTYLLETLISVFRLVQVCQSS